MERRERSPRRTGSNYGLACMQCVKAKCRCVPRAGGSCERCSRLKKDCQPSDSARRRMAQKEKESETRIAHLESKIDTLLSVIQAASGASSPSTDLQRLLSGGGVSLPTAGSSSSGASTQSISTNPSSSGGPSPSTDLHPTASQSPNPASPALTDVTPVEAEASFNFFRSRMLPCFPFISIGPFVSVWDVRRDRPFLFSAIMTVTTFSTQKKLARAEELKRAIFTSALLDVHSSFDLLLSVLTYLAWSTDAFLGRADLLSRLMMLAISLVYDLRLFKLPPPEVQVIVALTQGYSDEDHHTDEETLQSFVEKQRALLACFVLSSNISSHFGRIDALRWTPQMEEALRVIEKHKLYATDEWFVFEVRLHLLMQRAAHVREQHETERARASATTAASVPGFLYLKALRGQLQEFYDALSPHLQQQDILNAYTRYVELYIDQAGRFIGSDSSLLSVSGPSIDSTFVPGYERVGILWRSVESVKAWLDVFYKVPPAQCLGLPFHFWSQLIRCTTVLKYLSTLDDPAWDCESVRQKVDLLSVLEWMSKKLNLISEEAGLESNDDLFKLLSRLLNGSREWIKSKHKTSSAPVPARATDNGAVLDLHLPSTSLELDLPDLDHIPWLQSMDLENDKWFEDVLGWSPSAF